MQVTEIARMYAEAERSDTFAAHNDAVVLAKALLATERELAEVKQDRDGWIETLRKAEDELESLRSGKDDHSLSSASDATSQEPTLREKFEFMLSFLAKDNVPDDTFLAVSVHGIKPKTAHLKMAPTVGDLRRLLGMQSETRATCCGERDTIGQRCEDCPSAPSAEQFLRTDEPRECPDCWGNGYTYGIPEGDKLPCSTCAETGKVVPYRTSSSARFAPPDLMEALRAYQQADHDGVFVNVSREALDKAIELLSAMPSATTPTEELSQLYGLLDEERIEDAKAFIRRWANSADSQTNAASTNSDGSRRGDSDA